MSDLQSDVVAPKKRGRPRKDAHMPAAAAVAPAVTAPDVPPVDPARPARPYVPDDAVPSFSIAERRAKFGTALEQSIPDPLPLVGQPEPMATRGFNRDMWSGRIYQAQNGGWVPVKASELAVQASYLGLTEQPDGTVTQGDKGEVIYFKMPKRLYDQIQRGKAERRRQKRSSEAARKAQVQQAITGLASDAKDRGHDDLRSGISGGGIAECVYADGFYGVHFWPACARLAAQLAHPLHSTTRGRRLTLVGSGAPPSG